MAKEGTGNQQKYSDVDEIIADKKGIHVYVTKHYLCLTIHATIKEATPNCFSYLVLASFCQNEVYTCTLSVAIIILKK